MIFSSVFNTYLCPVLPNHFLPLFISKEQNRTEQNRGSCFPAPRKFCQNVIRLGCVYSALRLALRYGQSVSCSCPRLSVPLFSSLFYFRLFKGAKSVEFNLCSSRKCKKTEKHFRLTTKSEVTSLCMLLCCICFNVTLYCLLQTHSSLRSSLETIKSAIDEQNESGHLIERNAFILFVDSIFCRF